MAVIQPVSDVVRGRHVNLHFSPEGVALQGRGRKVQRRIQPQAARYEDIAAVGLAHGGRDLVITFIDERAPWAVVGLPAMQARWVEEVLGEMLWRRKQIEGPAFRTALAPDDLAAAIAPLSQPSGREPALLAELLLTQAMLHGVTDLHLLPTPGGYEARVRKDGQLLTLATVPMEPGKRALARLKIMAQMPAFPGRVSQTGSLTCEVRDRSVHVRLTSLPTVEGEKLTARLFDPTTRVVDLPALGMSPTVLDAVTAICAEPRGCLLVTGPAGSGKSTTMYACLEHIAAQTPPRSLCTVEEPVEFRLDGVDQTEVNRGAGLDFAEGLRTVLRQDPQVIMVGEIRDRETAEIAVQAGLTGHLIFSTIHAPHSAGVFARLTDMGLEPYLVVSSVTAVLAQRLVRRLCQACSQSYRPSAEELAALGALAGDVSGVELRRPGGCDDCGGTGYRGRTGLFELLPVSEALRQAILDKRPAHELERLASDTVGASLWSAGWDKVRQGETTLAEVRAVLGKPSS
ncbi:MAG: GspE/PulE family protein [Armatimonadetes bacterium]|nr:GspE/PulE family protein [Armatimonadota bacterium]